MPTAISAPANGPSTYAHHAVQWFSTSAGASERSVFIDAPLIGAAHRPASAMYPATPIAFSGPTFCAPEQVPRIVLTSPAVRSTSQSIAVVVLTPAPGSVSPASPAVHERDQREHGEHRADRLGDEVGRALASTESRGAARTPTSPPDSGALPTPSP